LHNQIILVEKTDNKKNTDLSSLGSVKFLLGIAMIQSHRVIIYYWQRIFNFLGFILLWLAMPTLGGVLHVEQSVGRWDKAFWCAD
jgi:hypothetical protein